VLEQLAITKAHSRLCYENQRQMKATGGDAAT
jgi:hypothetical protein